MDQPAAPYFDEPVRQSLRQPFRMQRVFARSFAAFARSFFPFMMLGVIVFSPLLVYLAAVLSDDTMFLDAIDVWKAVLAIGGGLLSLLLTATVIYGTFCQLRGEPSSVGRSIGVGLRRLLPVLGVGLLTAVIILLGFVALIVPGFILYCMLFAAIPVAVQRHLELHPRGNLSQLAHRVQHQDVHGCHHHLEHRRRRVRRGGDRSELPRSARGQGNRRPRPPHVDRRVGSASPLLARVRCVADSTRHSAIACRHVPHRRGTCTDSENYLVSPSAASQGTCSAAASIPRKRSRRQC